LRIVICAKALWWITSSLLFGCKINLKLLQPTIAPNEVTHALEELGWGLVLLALLGSNLLVSGIIVCCFFVVPKFANYNLCKSSLLGNILIAPGLQVNF